MKMFRRNQKGFTLIEALIVVIIVAILAVLGISRFLGVREATAKATCQSHQSTINSAIKKWTLDNNVAYPSDGSADADVLIDAGSPTCPTAGTAYTIDPAIVTINGVDTTEYHATCADADVGTAHQLSFAGTAPAAP